MTGRSLRSCWLPFALCLIVVVLSDARSAGAQITTPFSFTDVDLMLLDQVKRLDAKLENDGLVHSDPTLDALLTRLGTTIVAGKAVPERVEWRFRAVRDPTPNAFALPNGSIYVHTGLIGLLENDEQVAGVLAHEVTHVTDRHAYVAFRSYRKKAVASNLLSFAGGFAPVNVGWGLAVRIISSSVPSILAATINGYSRELEKDADLYAVDKLIAAGYDPAEMVSAFRLLRTTSDLEAETLFYTDHPKLQQRIVDVTAVVEARGVPRLSQDQLADARSRYLRDIEAASRQNIALAIAAGRLRSAVASARTLQEFRSESSENAYWLAEAYRALGPRTPEPSDEELTDGGRKDVLKRRERMTPTEEEKALLATPAGRVAQEQNQREAEMWYRRALELSPPTYEAYRGLGLLLETTRVNEAIAALQQYLTLVPEARDRSQILRRLGKLRGTASGPGANEAR